MNNDIIAVYKEYEDEFVYSGTIEFELLGSTHKLTGELNLDSVINTFISDSGKFIKYYKKSYPHKLEDVMIFEKKKLIQSLYKDYNKKIDQLRTIKTNMNETY